MKMIDVGTIDFNRPLAYIYFEVTI
jgi:hypothetical protein